MEFSWDISNDVFVQDSPRVSKNMGDWDWPPKYFVAEHVKHHPICVPAYQFWILPPGLDSSVEASTVTWAVASLPPLLIDDCKGWYPMQWAMGIIMIHDLGVLFLTNQD